MFICYDKDKSDDDVDDFELSIEGFRVQSLCEVFVVKIANHC